MPCGGKTSEALPSLPSESSVATLAAAGCYLGSTVRSENSPHARVRSHSDQRPATMRQGFSSLLLLVLTVISLASFTQAAAYAAARRTLLGPQECIEQCQAKCGGVCYMSMIFHYTCSCSRFG
ncbi:hypothetical protein RRG08_016239 [Elysia crispata]|uniref:Uncharacterized protein n=1 Tax=Elysia crispata TaxID=231223 RepID=A0AAE1DH00_9GAST|nr:hypothetical protein RRG08_016239 [Elysia crispata]